MKDFFKTALATTVGLIIFNLIVSVLMFVFIIIIASAGQGALKVKDNSVLSMKLNYPIPDRTDENPFANMAFNNTQPHKFLGLNDILMTIKRAKKDENIEGILLDITYLHAGQSTLDEIRTSLIDFRESGKFIYSYSPTYSQSAYYLATVSDSIFLNPEGMTTIVGAQWQNVFFKKALNRLGIEPQIFRAGKYKSAIEMFQNEKMSEENKEQISKWLNGFWENITQNIEEARNLEPGAIDGFATQLSINNAEDAVENGLVDVLLYDDEFHEKLKNRLSLEEEDKLELITLEKYSQLPPEPEVGKARKQKKKNKIAIIYAEGSIVLGKGDSDEIGSATFAKAIRKARKDSTVKAIVLRVNSGGGSALASDIIWREVQLASEVKPVVASMGNAAASGGYYIVTPANAIIANENTLTGSIGVWGLLFYANDFFDNKLGITTDIVKTNKSADLGSIFRKVTPEERMVIENSIDDVYETFLKRVADGRDMSTTEVHEIAQGRIWSGQDAKEIGLVDELGGLNTAISKAAGMANLEHYGIVEMPKSDDPFTQFIESLEGMKTKMIKKELGPYKVYYDEMKKVTKLQGVLTKLPFEVGSLLN